LTKPAPFVLRYVNSGGHACSFCKWNSNCYGCGIHANDEPITYLIREPFLAVDWNEIVLSTDFNDEMKLKDDPDFIN